MKGKTAPAPAAVEAAFPGQNAVTVVLASSSAFVPVCAAVIRSLAEYADRERFYDVVILHREIGEDDQRTVRETVADFPRFSVRFYNTAAITDRYDLRPSFHISIETYYRFLIPEILADCGKVLYLDCDLICRRDVGELYDTDLGENWLAAAPDPDMQGMAARDRGTRIYLQDTLKMKDPFRYFQAGVILMNCAALKRAHTTNEWLTFAAKHYRYADQDILNRYCYGHVLFLDMAWNVMIDCNDHFRVGVLIENGPRENKIAYENARRDPAIVHYAGGEKPWNKKDCDMAPYFWEIADKTPFREKLRAMLADHLAEDQEAGEDKKKRLPNGERRSVNFIKRCCPRFLFPLGRKLKRLFRL